MFVEMPSGNYTDCTYDEYKTIYYKYNDDPIQFLVTRTGNSLPIPGSKRKSAIISIDENRLRTDYVPLSASFAL